MTDDPDEDRLLQEALAAVEDTNAFLADELRRHALTLPAHSRTLLLAAAELLEHAGTSCLH
ncbi:hypothetical protein WDZ92_04275 [Nostoc sp. NIES-2111]